MEPMATARLWVSIQEAPFYGHTCRLSTQKHTGVGLLEFGPCISHIWLFIDMFFLGLLFAVHMTVASPLPVGCRSCSGSRQPVCISLAPPQPSMLSGRIKLHARTPTPPRVPSLHPPHPQNPACNPRGGRECKHKLASDSQCNRRYYGVTKRGNKVAMKGLTSSQGFAFDALFCEFEIVMFGVNY